MEQIPQCLQSRKPNEQLCRNEYKLYRHKFDLLLDYDQKKHHVQSAQLINPLKWKLIKPHKQMPKYKSAQPYPKWKKQKQRS